MTLSAITPSSQPPDRPPRVSHPSLTQWLWRDRLLLSAFLICGLLIGYQLAVTLLHPAWKGLVTDWLRAALAWPELLVVVAVTFWLTRTRRPVACSWWMLSLALLSYTVARNLWTVADRLIFSHGVPFPTFPDLFFVLQYPFFFFAVILLPGGHLRVPSLRMILDALLWISSATALSWYFILAPIYSQSGLSPLATLVSLAYPVGDLALLVGLVVALLRPSRSQADRLTLYVLCLALACLMVADTWVAVLLRVNPKPIYMTGNPPDLFWLAFYLLVPLAGVIRLRLAQHEPLPLPRNRDMPVKELTSQRLQRQDLLASLRFLCPFVAALLASAVITIWATVTSVPGGWRSLIAPLAVSFGLLLLVIVRQEVAFLESARLRREQQAAQVRTVARREAHRRLDAFPSTLSHGFKIPLAA